ncbi:hypothetical protein F5Y17DRAFT_203463 [Xylariaceae sp. FL0594]|nr:hypothetical protein F5Y17DRAFT_203463 [Xylariaceae sp. FL0594]
MCRSTHLYCVTLLQSLHPSLQMLASGFPRVPSSLPWFVGRMTSFGKFGRELDDALASSQAKPRGQVGRTIFEVLFSSMLGNSSSSLEALSQSTSIFIPDATPRCCTGASRHSGHQILESAGRTPQKLPGVLGNFQSSAYEVMDHIYVSLHFTARPLPATNAAIFQEGASSTARALPQRGVPVQLYIKSY